MQNIEELVKSFTHELDERVKPFLRQLEYGNLSKGAFPAHYPTLHLHEWFLGFDCISMSSGGLSVFFSTKSKTFGQEFDFQTRTLTGVMDYQRALDYIAERVRNIPVERITSFAVFLQRKIGDMPASKGLCVEQPVHHKDNGLYEFQISFQNNGSVERCRVYYSTATKQFGQDFDFDRNELIAPMDGSKNYNHIDQWLRAIRHKG